MFQNINTKFIVLPLIDDFINMTTREQDIIEHFNPKKNDTVVDVGAHLGRYALISSNRVDMKESYFNRSQSFSV